jgi:hypothetical protein
MLLSLKVQNYLLWIFKVMTFIIYKIDTCQKQFSRLQIVEAAMETSNRLINQY